MPQFDIFGHFSRDFDLLLQSEAELRSSQFTSITVPGTQLLVDAEGCTQGFVLLTFLVTIDLIDRKSTNKHLNLSCNFFTDDILPGF